MRPEFARSRKDRLAGPDRPRCRLQRHRAGERDPASDSPAVTTQPTCGPHWGRSGRTPTNSAATPSRVWRLAVAHGPAPAVAPLSPLGTPSAVQRLR